MANGKEYCKKSTDESVIIENEVFFPGSANDSDALARELTKPVKLIDIEKLITYANLHGWF
ncbi:MAG TPA: hypothetical protein VIO11_01315 [Candidatus Methanoperedens sp.]